MGIVCHSHIVGLIAQDHWIVSHGRRLYQGPAFTCELSAGGTDGGDMKR